MNIAGVQSGMVGMALFDMWMDCLRASNKAHQTIGSPLLKAASDAFESYIATQEAGHTAQIAGLAAYVMTPKGGAQGISPQQLAPFLALNIMA